MRFVEELRDPWGVVVAGVAGGLAWGVHLPGLAAVGVGAVVYGVKTAAGLMLDRPRAGPKGPARPPRGSRAAALLQRADGALDSLRSLTRSAPAGAARDAAEAVVRGADEALAALRRLAAQVAAVDAALTHIDAAGSRAVERQLVTELAGMAPGEVRTEREHALASVREQLAVSDRLIATRQALLARMDSAVLGLDGLVARLAEVLAMAAGAGSLDTGPARIDELTGELDGLRAGLAETEATSRHVLRRTGTD